MTIDGEFGYDYQMFVLRRMVGELPPKASQLINEQLDAVAEALVSRHRLIKAAVARELEDVRLNVLSMEFDIEATQRERDELQERLDKLL